MIFLFRYGSSDLSISRVLQNRRFDFAMVAFLDCLRQLIEWVGERDGSVRIPHRVVSLQTFSFFLDCISSPWIYRSQWRD